MGYFGLLVSVWREPYGRARLVRSQYSARYRRFLTRLKAARLKAGLTQSQVAAALRRPQSFMSKCESGERRIDIIELEDFARVYGKPVTFFLLGEEPERPRGQRPPG